MMGSVPVKKGYKRTEVGIIPLDWEVYQLRSLVSYTNGKAHEGCVRDDGRYVLVNSKFISTDGEVKKYSDECFTPTSVGDVLMVMSDVPNGRAIARCFLVDENNFYTVNQRICRLTPIHVNNRLLCYKLDRNPYYLSFDDGAKQTNLRKEDVLSCPLGLPSKPHEQRAIATALSDVDALIGALDKLIAKKRAIKLATMQELLTGKSRLPGFCREWTATTLGEIVDIKNGGTPSTQVPAFWNGTIPWCTPTDLTSRPGKYLIATDRCITPEGLAHCGATLLPAGSLLLCSRATIGELKIAVSEVCTNQGFKSLLCRDGVYYEFLYYLVLTLKPQLIERAIGSTFLEIGKRDVAAIAVVVPAEEEQKAIAAVLFDMDTEIAALEQRRNKTKAIKQGMMQELLTGRIRLIQPEPIKEAHT